MSAKIRIAIIGSGGFGREVYHLLNDDLYECVGFIDHAKQDIILKAPIIGCESDMEQLMIDYAFSNCVLAVGDIKKRQKILNKIKNYSLEYPVISDCTVRNFNNDIEDGSIFYPNVVVMNNCHIGKFSLLNSGVTLGHDVVIGDYCNINPGAHLAGRITVGDCTLIGIGASIKENINIGENTVIGAGSVVINDVPDNTTVYGVPARAVNS
jgi:sugar O-acyltransferase (sialic acid O-acetyltransferase NeuD family)